MQLRRHPEVICERLKTMRVLRNEIEGKYGFGTVAQRLVIRFQNKLHDTLESRVNMRLGPGGVREHQQAEWAVMTYGNCRVTILDESGRPEVADVKEGDLWYFPAGFPQ